MYCSNCGHELHTDATFCSYCGKEVKAQVDTVLANDREMDEVKQHKTKNDEQGKLWEKTLNRKQFFCYSFRDAYNSGNVTEYSLF